jgi:uncharacterized protein YjbI with pentapeptide repeats
MTQDELKEVLRLHGMWLRDEAGGKRANLSRADLSGANLRGAKGIIRIGPSKDGCEFFAVRRDGAVWIKAGCRWFTAADARAHWQKTRPDTPLGAERLRFVDFLEANCPE